MYILVVLLLVTIQQISSVQVATDPSQFPLTFGSDSIPFDVSVKDMDRDSAGNLIVLASMFQAPAIKRQVLMRFNSPAFINAWIVDYQIDTTISFFVDRIRLRPIDDTKAIMWTSNYFTPQKPYILLVDLVLRQVTQIISITSAIVDALFLDMSNGCIFLVYKDS